MDLIILNDATPLLKYEIYKNNILLFTNDKAIESKYKVKTLFEYNDMKRYLDLSYDKNIERLKEDLAKEKYEYIQVKTVDEGHYKEDRFYGI